MTVGEAVRALDAFGERRKDRAYFEYSNALAIGLFIGAMFSGAHKAPELQDIFPDLFPRDEVKEEEAKDSASAANFINFANAFNRRYEPNGNGKPESENNG